MYSHEQREAEQCINFVTSHAGFTLNDLVSYNQKHNEPNGEGNLDGTNDNRSWNRGIEGPTNDLAVECLRNRQIKNFLTVTLLSLGMPMIVWIDTALETPHDIVEWEMAPPVAGQSYRAEPRSGVVFFANTGKQEQASQNDPNA